LFRFFILEAVFVLEHCLQLPYLVLVDSLHLALGGVVFPVPFALLHPFLIRVASQLGDVSDVVFFF